MKDKTKTGKIENLRQRRAGTEKRQKKRKKKTLREEKRKEREREWKK